MGLCWCPSHGKSPLETVHAARSDEWRQNMTLVYATIEKKQISLFSDTKSSDPLNLKADSFSNFTLKVFPISTNLTLAFAGDVHFGNAAVTALFGVTSVIEAKNRLLEIHIAREESVEFILASQDPLRLFKISNGSSVRQKQSCWIGNKGAFEELQKFRLSPPSNQGGTSMSIVKVGDPKQGTTSGTYASNLDAFFEVVLQNENDVGGFVVPFLITRQSREFGTYCKSFRKPLSFGEVGPNNSTVNWQFNRPEEGAYTVNFGGNETSFSLEVPQAGKKISWKVPRTPLPIADGFGLG